MNSESRVKYSSLAPVTSDSQLISAVNSIIQNLTPLVGQHTNKNEKAVVWADLLKYGLMNVKGITIDGYPDYTPPPPVNPDMTVPPAIANFEGFASFNYVTFSWDQPRYGNHSHVELWRANGFKKDIGGAEVPAVLDDAVFRLMTTSIVCSDTVLPADKWRYWARNVSKTGVKGPWTSIDGMLIEVPESPRYLLDKITGEIMEGDLYPLLGEKIDDSYNGMVSLEELTSSSYTVRIDTGGAVHGFGLMVDGTTSRSDFIIRSDRFAIAAPQQYDQAGEPIVSTAAFPFIVDVTNPANPKVLIKNAYIDKAYIESLVTGSLIADKIVGQTITGTHIRGGDMVIGSNFNVDGAGSATLLNAFVKGTIQSANYGAGVSGWQIHNNGNAELNNAVLRGTVYATGGWFQGTVYAEKMVGGVYSQKLYTSAASAMSGSTSFRTAFTMTVARGMSVARAIELASDIGIANCQVQAVATTPEMNAWGKGIFELRVLRDGATVHTAQFEVVATPPYSGPNGSSTADTKYGLLPARVALAVQGDSATHTYTVQYRVAGTDASSGSVEVTPLIGVTGNLTTFGRLYIDNGDLA